MEGVNCPYLRDIVFARIDKISEGDPNDEEPAEHYHHQPRAQLVQQERKEPHNCYREESEENSDIVRKMNHRSMPVRKLLGEVSNLLPTPREHSPEGEAFSNKILSMVAAESYLAETMESFEENFTGEDEEHIHGEPYVMTNKPMPTMNNECTTLEEAVKPTFYGVVSVIEASYSLDLSTEVCQCLIDNFTLKLTQNSEVKLFIDLNKYELTVLSEKQYVKLMMSSKRIFKLAVP